MRKITQYLKKREWAYIGISFLFIIAQVWLDLKMPDYMSEITTLIQTPGNSIDAVLSAGGYMLLCALGSMVAAMVTGYFVAKVGAILSMRLRGAVFDKTLEFSMEELGYFSIGSLITRCTNDVTQVQMLVTMGLQVAVKAPILAIWAISKIIRQNQLWAIATGIAVVLLLLVFAAIVLIIMPRFSIIQKLTDILNRITREHITGLRVIRAYNAQERHKVQFEETNDALTSNNLFIGKVISFLMPAISSIMSGISLAIYVLGAWMIQQTASANKLLLFSEMVVFSSYAMQVISAFMMLAVIFIILPRAVVSVRRIMEVIETPIHLKDGQKTDGIPEMEGTVEFRNVSFRYPDAQEDVLHNISFTAAKGETVAFIGSTGCGKSSIVNLIPRFYDAVDGEVLVDGLDVREYSQKALRDKIAYVPQKSTLFSGTVSSNISYGESKRFSLRAEDIKAAAVIGQAHKFIKKKEEGYESHVAQGGSNFSGGQKQRLSIARAVYRRPEIYLFDDSFSALDYKTDREVRAALHETAKDATVLIVAQRIGTIRHADRIVVLNEGKAVGIGTHDELINSCAVYREIALSQLSEKEIS